LTDSVDIDDAPTVREAIGSVLREERFAQERTLRDVASDAAVSLPYLSEVERGRKDVSSEVLGAISRSLDLSPADVLERAARRIRGTTCTGAQLRLAA